MKASKIAEDFMLQGNNRSLLNSVIGEKLLELYPDKFISKEAARNAIRRARNNNPHLQRTEDEIDAAMGRRVIGGEHIGLAKECEEVGIPPESVGHYWYKGKHYSIHAKPEKSAIKEFEEYFEVAKKTISEFEFKPLIHAGGDKLLVVCIFDLHLGKLAWRDETGDDYDLKIATQRFKDAIEDLISKTSGYAIEKILFPVGNDIYNSDRALPYSQTTAGTPQMDDTRWQKLFKTGTELITWATLRLAEIAPVDVVTVFSNHDFERVFYLGCVLEAAFDKHTAINVDNSPRGRKYYQYGMCGFGLAHGHNEKPQDLPLIMAQESPQMWSDTWYREWLLGHLHHKYKLLTQEAKDYRGVRVTYLTTPSSADSWHYLKAFTGAIKGAEGLVYDKEEGMVGTAVHNIR